MYTQWEREHHSTCFLLFCETQTSGTLKPSLLLCLQLHFSPAILTPKISCQQFWPFLLHLYNLLWNVKSCTILSLCPKLFIPFHNLYTIFQFCSYWQTTNPFENFSKCYPKKSLELSYHSFPNYHKKTPQDINSHYLSCAANDAEILNKSMTAQIPKPTILYMFYSDAIA